MRIETHRIEVACGGLCRFLGVNALTKILPENIYHTLNDLVCQRRSIAYMDALLNGFTSDKWKVEYIAGGGAGSFQRDSYMFIRVVE